MAVSRDIKYAHIDELLLDPKNPRLGRRFLGHAVSQAEVVEIIRGWDLEELAVSFIESGFWPQEALLVVLDPEVDATGLVVVEGNRRLAALKLLYDAKGGSPRTRKWEELAQESRDPELFTRIPYLVAEDRDDIRKFLGFRHVTGIKEWAPAEKAQYIAGMVDSGMSYVDVMRAIGSKTPTVRRNYISYNILRQLDDSDEVDVGLVEDRFSILFLALREHGVQDFLGVDIEAEPDAARAPVSPGEYMANLEYFIRWVFGTREVPPLFSDSRFITKFSRILENGEAVEYLKSARSPSLAAAASKAGTDADDVLDHLTAATDEVEQALSTVHLYRERDDVQTAVARLVSGMDALLGSFSEQREILCREREP